MQTRKHDIYGEITPQKISWADDTYYESDTCPECVGSGYLEFGDENIMDYCPFCMNGVLDSDDAIFFNECTHSLMRERFIEQKRRIDRCVNMLLHIMNTHKKYSMHYRTSERIYNLLVK